MQHYLAVVDVLNSLGVRVEILTGSVKGKKREKLLAEIREGVVDIVVGTHALIEDSVEFKNLGLIVIDEQHRFGVVQRKKLRDKGVLSNLIVHVGYAYTKVTGPKYIRGLGRVYNRRTASWKKTYKD